MASQAEIVRMSSFWRTVTWARLASSASERRSRDVGDGAHLPLEVVLHVAEVAAQLGVGARELAGGQPPERLEQRLGVPVEVEDLALELEDALAGVVGAARPVDGEHGVLDLGHVVVEAVDHRHVVVDDAVHHRVEHRHRAAADPAEVVLDGAPHLGQGAGLAVAHRDDVARADEELELGELAPSRRRRRSEPS